MKNVYSDILISNPGTRLNGNTLTCEVRLPWYRALPVSVVRVPEILIDGTSLPLADAELEVNGKRMSLTAAADETKEFWFVLDSIFVHVPVKGVDAAKPHKVELLLNLHPPYIPMLTWTTRGTTSLNA